MKRIVFLLVIVFSFVSIRTQMQIKKSLKIFCEKYAIAHPNPLYRHVRAVPLMAVLKPDEAAKKGDPAAQMALGRAYARGDIVLKNNVKAVSWYQKAADQGYADGQLAMGDAYYHGRGVLQDDQQSTFWYQKAAAQNNAEAETRLGFAYHQARGVPKNEVTSFSWFQKAANQGFPLAQGMVPLLKGWLVLLIIMVVACLKIRHRPCSGIKRPLIRAI